MYTEEEMQQSLFENYASYNINPDEDYITEKAYQVSLLPPCQERILDYSKLPEVESKILLNEIESILGLLNNSDMDSEEVVDRFDHSKFDATVLAVGLLRNEVDPLKVVKAVLDIPDIDFDQLIEIAWHHNNINLAELVKILLDADFDLVSLIKFAAECGHTAVVKLLLNDMHVSPKDQSKMYKFAIKHAAINGQTDLVLALLYEIGLNKTDVASKYLLNDCYILAVKYAAQNNHEKMVMLLIHDSHHSSDECKHLYQLAIKYAAMSGHAELVIFLLETLQSSIDNVDIKPENVYKSYELAVRYATKNNNTDIIKRLLNEHNISRTAVLQVAIQEYSLKIILMLLSNYDVHINSALELASKENNMEIVKELLDLSGVNLRLILEYAAQESHIGVVLAVLARSPSASPYYISLFEHAFKIAIRHDNIELVKVLMTKVPLKERLTLCEFGVKNSAPSQYKLISVLEMIKAEDIENCVVSGSRGKFVFWENSLSANRTPEPELRSPSRRRERR